MSLASFIPETRDVKIGDRVVCSVSGLAVMHVEVLVRTHLDDIEALVDLILGSAGNFEPQDLKKLGMALVTQAPGFVANVIALAAGERDATEKAARLPLPVQLQAMADIVELTFTEVGGIKKFMETVVGLLSSLSPSLPEKLKGAATMMGNPA